MANKIAFSVDHKAVNYLIRKLTTLGPKLEKKYMAKATTAAMKPVQSEAKRNARKTKRTGFLSKNIGIVTRQYPRKGVTMTIVGPSNIKDPRTGENPANIGHLIEFPVKPHPINHPGFEGRPFLRPAYDSKIGIANQIFRDKLIEAIEKEALA